MRDDVQPFAQKDAQAIRDRWRVRGHPKVVTLTRFVTFWPRNELGGEPTPHPATGASLGPQAQGLLGSDGAGPNQSSEVHHQRVP